MPLKRSQWVVFLSSFSILLLLGGYVQVDAQPAPPAPDAAAVEARKQCDALASHPHDPGRYSAGVKDDQLAPGAAIEACEPAVKLNPDLARLWFELGRAYWSAQRDKEAFSAFIEASRRNYAPAQKYIGDAYLENRGLPSGEHQDAQRAMDWYKKSADGGFRDAVTALREVEAAIQKKTDDAEQDRLRAAHEAEDARIAAEKARVEAEKARFDPSAFQNKEFMSALYYNSNISSTKSDVFSAYIIGFLQELGGDQILFVDSYCKPLAQPAAFVLTSLDMASLTMRYMTPDEARVATMKALRGEPYIPRGVLMLTASNDQGTRDAVNVVNRYGCKSDVAHKIMDGVVARFSRRGGTQEQIIAPPSTQGGDGPSFDCRRSSSPDEFAVCGNSALSQLDNKLSQLYTNILQSANQTNKQNLRIAQRNWLGQRKQCGSNVACLRSQYEARIQELQ